MSGTTSQTIGTLINQALRMTGVIGVGETAQPQDVNDALALTNMMLATWNADRALVFGLEDVSLVSTGARSYTIGTGALFNTPRPDRIEAAYMRLLTPGATQYTDFSLTIINSMEDYSRIQLKTLTSFATSVFYESDYPTGTLYFWPIPQASIYELHVVVKQPLGQFSGLSQNIALPPPYQEAVLWNLCARLRPLYGMQPDPTIMALAQSTLENLRASNAQVSRLSMPSNIPGMGGNGVFNPFSGTVQ